MLRYILAGKFDHLIKGRELSILRKIILGRCFEWFSMNGVPDVNFLNYCDKLNELRGIKSYVL